MGKHNFRRLIRLVKEEAADPGSHLWQGLYILAGGVLGASGGAAVMKYGLEREALSFILLGAGPGAVIGTGVGSFLFGYVNRDSRGNQTVK